MKLKDLYVKGQKALSDKKRKEDEERPGRLRAGNSGVILPSGDVIGSCHRMAYLRMLPGVERDVDFSTKLMFEGGLGNETIWAEALKAAGVNFKCEEEIPTEWKTTNNTPVTGRPDVVILDDKGSPSVGIELKELSSVWTIRDVMFKGNPKTAHLCQAMHYSWQLGIPYKLAYASRCVFAVGGWAGKQFPKIDHQQAVHMEYNDKGEAKNVRPVMVVYDLEIDGKGRLMVKKEDEDIFSPTNLTVDGLKDYYETVSTMADDDHLGPRPAPLTALGEKMGYDPCAYCELCECCAKFESQGLKRWLEEVKRTYNAGAVK